MYIKELLTAYEKQTVLPDEIVISVSQVQKIPNNILDELQQGSWLFSVTILSSKKQLFAGQNRNIAGTHAKGDILICQDADDLPHSQRVEIIKYFFEQYNPDFLMHQYRLSHEIDIEILTEYDFYGNPVGMNVEREWDEFILNQNNKKCVKN